MFSKNYFHMINHSYHGIPDADYWKFRNNIHDSIKTRDIQNNGFTVDNVPKEVDAYVNNSRWLNADLWRYKLKGDFFESGSEKHTKEISKQVNDHKLNSDVELYTGLSPEFHIPKEGGLFHVPSFISTSLNPIVAAKHAAKMGTHEPSIMLRIHRKKGSSGLYTPEFSPFDTEQEVILPHNSVLKIHPHKEIYSFKDAQGDKELHVHDAEILNDADIVANRHHPEVKSYLRMKGLLK